MRADAMGFFWADEPPKPKVKAEKEKRQPPEPTWLAPDYLPGLEEAQAFNVPLFTDAELVEASQSWIRTAKRHRMAFDIEVYPNYFLVAFKSLENGKITFVEESDRCRLDLAKLSWIVENFTLVSFNGNNFDAPVVSLALSGKPLGVLQRATEQIIMEGWRPYEVLKQYKAKEVKFDHIDLMEVAPLRASLKIYGGRVHVKKMQDLPFPPGTNLSTLQQDIVRWYCVNDLDATEALYRELKDELILREELTLEHGIDLRSKSDAQIAEAVIANEIQRLTGSRPKAPTILPGTVYRYRVPAFLQYQTPLMKWVLDLVARTDFVVSEFGNVGMPQSLSDLEIRIANSVYRMGIGGLHSTEKSAKHESNERYILKDRDVTSYYPFIILNQALYPHHLGPVFLQVYRGIVERRLAAKARGDKKVSDSLKIVINGSFGKLGSMYSILYSPDLLIQTTITGQLSLLLLIESLELAGFSVVSANTDGVVIKCERNREAECDAIVGQWEKQTQFQTEEKPYRAIYSRDVNNYLAIEVNGKTKGKGIFATPGLQKNPANWICVEAVQELLVKGVPINHTIRECLDIKKFVNVRTVKGGAVKDGEYLGKSIRWYYGTNTDGEIVYASSGNKVPRSDGAVPLMVMDDSLPEDINYDWYIKESEKLLEQIGF